MVHSSMEIKSTIGLLCKLLNVIFETNLKPELFRLAKFNKTEENIVSLLWSAIFKILNVSNIDEAKQKFCKLNYKRKKIYFSDQVHCGSRELLLAISFLIPNMLTKEIILKLSSSVFSKNYQIFDDKICLQSEPPFREGSISDEDLKNYKKWLCGKIHLNKNMITEYQNQINKIQIKISQNVNIKERDNLTTYEILAIKNKKIGEQFLNDCEHTLKILGLYTEWVKHEKYFWRWMESVLQEDKK